MHKDKYRQRASRVVDIVDYYLRPQQLKKELPLLPIIARKVRLSESTLKRSFQIAYGASVYDYYLYRKMQIARDVLIDKDLSVSVVAEMMGYKKVSNFITIFKNVHGYTPGRIK